MTSPLMKLVARTVAASPLAEDCLVTTGGQTYAVRATYPPREQNSEGGVRFEKSIRYPSESSPLPVKDDPVRLSGEMLYVVSAIVTGPVYEVTLTARRTRDART